jgi:hypothetical protein
VAAPRALAGPTDRAARRRAAVRHQRVDRRSPLGRAGGAYLPAGARRARRRPKALRATPATSRPRGRDGTGRRAAQTSSSASSATPTSA